MVKYCEFCGAKNEDSYDYCYRCGKSLSSVRIFPLVLIYIITIFASWGWVLIPKTSVFSFWCLVFPFFYFSSSNSKLRKHGYILMVICLTGSLLNLFLILS